MIRRIKLYARINAGDGNFPRVAVDFHKNGRPIKPDGHVTTYLIRKAGKFNDVGTADFETALTRLRQEEALLTGGVVPAGPVPVVHASHTSGSIAEAVGEYKQEMRTLDKNKNTIGVYSKAVDDFAACCKKTNLGDIDRKDILAYIQWIQDNVEVRTKDGKPQTIKNRLEHLSIFLNKHGIRLRKKRSANGLNDPGLLFFEDRPKVVKKKPVKYDQETIDQLVTAADVDQKDYLLFLLWSGFRDEEVQHLQYSDFDWKKSTVSVHTKPQFGWKPKDAEERTITLPGEVSKMMKLRMDRPQTYANGYRKPEVDDLVFPNEDGRPDCHLLRHLHAVAKKVGLNLKGKRAGHMFRKTAGTRVAKKFGLADAMEFLGHANLTTTARYLAADKAGSKTREAYNEMFANGD